MLMMPPCHTWKNYKEMSIIYIQLLEGTYLTSDPFRGFLIWHNLEWIRMWKWSWKSHILQNEQWYWFCLLVKATFAESPVIGVSSSYSHSVAVEESWSALLGEFQIIFLYYNLIKFSCLSYKSLLNVAPCLPLLYNFLATLSKATVA